MRRETRNQKRESLNRAAEGDGAAAGGGGAGGKGKGGKGEKGGQGFRGGKKREKKANAGEEVEQLVEEVCSNAHSISPPCRGRARFRA